MSAFSTRRWAIAYDCPCDKRRRKLSVLLQGYGVRVQESVFECELQAQLFQRLLERLQRLIRPAEDSVRLWPLSRRCCARIVDLGRPVATPAMGDVVL